MLTLKRWLVRSPLAKPAQTVRDVRARLKVMRYPGLRPVLIDEPRLMTRVLDRLITPDTNCIDIGCHIGSMLVEMLRRAPNGRHMAVEASPAKTPWLTANFPEVDILPFALSDHDGDVSFHEDLERPGFSGLAKRNGADRVRTVTVPCRRLDDVYPADRPLHFIKIDVEGAEELVLRGGQKTLASHRPAIIFESGPAGAERMGLTTRGLYDCLTRDLGYNILLLGDYLAGRPPLDPVGFDAAHRYPFAAFNYLAMPSRMTATAKADG